MPSNHVTLLPSISAPRCLQICNHSPLLPLPFPLLMCCKYTIPYIEVSGMRGWWRAGPIIFSTSSSCNDPWVEELHFAKGCLQTTKQDTNYFTFYLLLFTGNCPFGMKWDGSLGIWCNFFNDSGNKNTKVHKTTMILLMERPQPILKLFCCPITNYK